MKKLFAFAAFAAAVSLAASCEKSGESVFTEALTGPARISLSISGNTATKATVAGTDSENAINSVDVFVFFKGGEYDGRLDAYARFASAPYDLNATTGDREIYVLVNSEQDADVLAAVSDKASLLSLGATLAAQKDASGNPGNFCMTGSVIRSEATANALVAGVNNITVKVSRMVSRVRVLKISRDFESSALAGQSFSIDAVYLSNGVTSGLYGSGFVPAADDFANKLGVQDAAYDKWYYRPVGVNLANEAEKQMDDASFSLYTMPNPIDTDSEEKPFTVRNTKLVVKAALNGKTVYYVIPLGTLESNTSYDIANLVITRPGSSDPEKKTELASCEFSIEVNPWTVVPLETETGKYVI